MIVLYFGSRLPSASFQQDTSPDSRRRTTKRICLLLVFRANSSAASTGYVSPGLQSSSVYCKQRTLVYPGPWTRRRDAPTSTFACCMEYYRTQTEQVRKGCGVIGTPATNRGGVCTMHTLMRNLHPVIRPNLSPSPHTHNTCIPYSVLRIEYTLSHAIQGIPQYVTPLATRCQGHSADEIGSFATTLLISLCSHVRGDW